MTFWLEVRESVTRYLPRFAYLRRREPIGDADSVFEYARTRAAFVCQKKLYGYIKTRVGTRFPKLMDDDIFVQSLNIAKLEIFAACMADMTCFCVSEATRDTNIGNERRADLARHCYRLGILDNDDGSCGGDAAERWLAAFEERLGRTVWQASGPAHFTESPKALVRWAPIADDLKKLDVEIVENSILNAWIEFRSEFVERLDRDALAASLAG